MGRTDYEAGASQVDGRPRGRRKSSGMGGSGSDELSAAALAWAWRHHRPECTGTIRHLAQHAAHGLGVQDNQERRSRSGTQRPVRCDFALKGRGFSRWPDMSKTFAISIIETLRQQGFQAYMVGGCVRDLLLKREPADYDIATSATPAQVMEIFPDTYAVGAQFGVVLVPLPEDQRTGGDNGPGGNDLPKSQAIEVATFR